MAFLELIDDDVVFIVAGRPVMRGKAPFIDLSRARQGKARVDGRVDIQEVRVFGDWAYVWNQLSVTVTPEAAVCRSHGRPVDVESPAQKVRRPLGRRPRRQHGDAAGKLEVRSRR